MYKGDDVIMSIPCSFTTLKQPNRDLSYRRGIYEAYTAGGVFSIVPGSDCTYRPRSNGYKVLSKTWFGFADVSTMADIGFLSGILIVLLCLAFVIEFIT